MPEDTPRFGLVVPNQQPSDVAISTRLDGVVRFVRQARDDGWDSILFGQHFLSTGLQHIQPIPLAARMIPESGDMSLVLGIVLIALLNPVETAESIASLDVLSDGRVIFGAGLGYRDVEYDAFGVTNGTRVSHFETNLDVMRRLWSGDAVSVDVPWCRLDGAVLTMPPVQGAELPVVIAANNDPAVARAARLGDSWLINPHARTDTVLRQLVLFRAARAEAQLPPVKTLPIMREVLCAPTREEAHQLAETYLGAKYVNYARWGQDKAMPGEEHFDIAFETLEEDRFVIGTPDDCLEALAPWRRDVGVDHFVYRVHWSGMPIEVVLRSQQLLALHVNPVLRDMSPAERNGPPQH
jgi:alkanesulfonate monooxygenase SsuD/methylene tetrahydromethanopterin reductase-like flavin-dependent oxidoreductase (luciferase family)